LGDTQPIACSWSAAGGPVVASDGEQPVVALSVLLPQNRGGDRKVEVGIEQVAGVTIVALLVAQVDLAQPCVDAGRRRY
jgi:hypothetical protein